MKLETPDLPDQEFDLTPMIDVVFLLIIFFMVVAAEITEKIQIEMPVAEQARVPEETGRRMELSIQEDGGVFIGLMPVDLVRLGREVRLSNETIPEFRVFIRADSRVPHRYVREVMEVCADSGVFDIIFATFKD